MRGKGTIAVSDSVSADDRQVEIAYDALVTGWPLLGGWTQRLKQPELDRRRLNERAAIWEGEHRNFGFLDPPALAAAKLWLEGPYATELGKSHAVEELVAATEARQRQEEAQRQEYLANLEKAKSAEEELRIAAERRVRERARDNRRLRIGLTIAIVALLLAVAGFAAAWKQSTVAVEAAAKETKARQVADSEAQRAVAAETAASEALSRQIGARMAEVATTAPDLAALLALEAIDRAPTLEARQSLANLLIDSPQRFAVRPVGKSNAVARFNPDGSVLAIGRNDGRVEVWERSDRSWQQRPGFQADNGGLADLAFDPESGSLATAGVDQSIAVWDATTGERRGDSPSGEEQGFEGGNDVAFSADGGLLAWGANDQAVRIWDFERGELSWTLCAADLTATDFDEEEDSPCLAPEDGPLWITSLAFSPVQHVLVAGDEAGQIVMWERREAGDWQPGRPVAAGLYGVESLAFSSSEPLLAAGHADGTVAIFDVETWQEVDRIQSPYIARANAVGFSKDGQILGVAGDDGKSVLWERRDGDWKVHDVLNGPTGKVTGLTFSPTESLVASAHFDGSVIVSDYSDTSALALAPPVELGSSASSVALDRTGTLLAAGHGDGRIRIFAEDLEGWKEEPLAPSQGVSAVSSLAFSLNQPLLATGDELGAITLWTKAGQTWQPGLVLTDEAAVSVRSLALDSDAPLLAAGYDDGRVVLWDLQTPGLATPLPVQTATGQPVGALAFSMTGRRLAAGYHDGALRMWNLDDWRQPSEVALDASGAAHSGPVKGLVFGEGGELVSGSEDRTIRLWNLADPTLNVEIPIEAAVTSVAFAAHGELLVVGAGSRKIALVYLADSRKRIDLAVDGYADAISAMAVVGEGQTLVAVDADGTMVAWDVDLTSWINRACALAGRAMTEEEELTYLGEPARHDCFSAPVT